MRIYNKSIKTILLFITFLSLGDLFAQCPSAIVESKTKVFYKDILNEYTLRLVKGGRFTTTTDNGEILTIDNKKYIKPTRLGKITIAIKEIQSNGATIELYDYFVCETMPNPTISTITNNHDTSVLENSISNRQFKTIQFLTIKSIIPNVSFKSTVESFTITVIGQKNKSKIIDAKGTDNLQEILNVKTGDKVILTNIKIKIEGELDSRVLENRMTEIVE